MSRQTSQVQPRNLNTEEMTLLELYQRQDAMATQLWQQFLFVNVAVVAVIVLISVLFKEFWETLGLSLFVALVWGTFTFGGYSALKNSQNILMELAHRIDGAMADKLGKAFVDATRPIEGWFGIKIFHVLVDVGVFGLCVLLINKLH